MPGSGREPDLEELEALAGVLREHSARRAEALVLDAYVACLEAQEAMRAASSAVALGREVAESDMTGDLFGQLLQLEQQAAPRFTWRQASHGSGVVRFLGRVGTARAVVHQPRIGVAMWRWDVLVEDGLRESGDALSALQGAKQAEQAYATLVDSRA